MANPLLTPEKTWGKAVLSWGMLPLTLGIGAWDGVVSTLRVYEHADLLEMATGESGLDARWRFGTYRYALGGEGYFFCGAPI